MEYKTLEEVLKGAPKGTVAYFDGTGLWVCPKKFKKNTAGKWDDKKNSLWDQSSYHLAGGEGNSCTVIDPNGRRLWPLLAPACVTEPEPQLKDYENAELAQFDTIFLSGTLKNRIKSWEGGKWGDRDRCNLSNAEVQEYLNDGTGILVLNSEIGAVRDFLKAHRRLQDG